MEISADSLQVNHKLADQVHAYLRAAILTNELAPGDRIVEAELSRKLVMSRSPIREAIKRLEQEGLVVVSRLRVTVRAVPYSEIVEMFHIRCALEGMAAWLATNRLTESELLRLEDLCSKQLAAMDDPDTRSNSNLQGAIGEEFHAVFIAACGSHRLQEALAGIKEHINHYRPVSVARPGRLFDALRGHRELVEAFRRRDADGADRIVRNHIMTAVEALSGSWV